jgi:hypothetical protein
MQGTKSGRDSILFVAGIDEVPYTVAIDSVIGLL